MGSRCSQTMPGRDTARLASEGSGPACPTRQAKSSRESQPTQRSNVSAIAAPLEFSRSSSYSGSPRAVIISPPLAFDGDKRAWRWSAAALHPAGRVLNGQRAAPRAVEVPITIAVCVSDPSREHDAQPVIARPVLKLGVDIDAARAARQRAVTSTGRSTVSAERAARSSSARPAAGTWGERADSRRRARSGAAARERHQAVTLWRAIVVLVAPVATIRQPVQPGEALIALSVTVSVPVWGRSSAETHFRPSCLVSL